MAPAPQEFGVADQLSTGTNNILSGNEVVISGISGVFPSSENTKKFAENLLNNVDLVTQDDLNFHHPEAPKHLGKIKGMEKFDAQFFRVTYAHALSMEPQSRKLLEQAYTAMYDSGINPLAYKGKKVGVFVGSSYSDTSNIAMFSNYKTQGYVLSGCGKSMFSNRISYWIDAKGPSYTLDCACASSMVCLEHAYTAMTQGECEAAVVGGCNVCYEPNLGLNLRRTGTVCLDGKTKCFDKNADGAVRAEAISCIFLQKAKDAKRIYAEVVFADVTYGLKEDSHFLPLGNKEDFKRFLEEFYTKAKVSPKAVEYIEANGTAVRTVDTIELETIDKVFANNRKVKVGSVKSNMGHSEPASGLCAVTKMCLAYHEGKLPANLHYSDPLDIPGVKEGRIKILKQNETFDRGYTAVNNFSINGTNCHVLLKGHYKRKDITKYKSNIPRLVLVSGRQDEAIVKIFDILTSQPVDPEVIGMLQNIYQIDTPGHTSRGYMIIDTNENNETISLARNAAYYSGIKRPLWLVFSGMGSQWPGMAADLMKIPTFATSMQRCHKALEPFGVDLLDIVTNHNKTVFDKILHCFIGISAVQIGLIDVLKSIGVNPDYIIGHSQGEMACAYWDDTFTLEETILAAYSRGLASTENHFIKGSMAAVGLGYKNIKPMCPPDIDVACHNSNESATLSGPADEMKAFIGELTSKGIFAREVPSTGIAFHSRYIKHAGPDFLQRLKKIIRQPKLRSDKWISTSAPQDIWHEESVKYSSAEYHTNNLLNPVLFEEAAYLIPKEAVVVEVAPHGLLQAVLKRSHPECTHIPLTRRGQDDQVKFVLEAVGKIYQEGFDMKIENLYPKIEYPVSTETEMISHYVEWEHGESWPEIKHHKVKHITSASQDLFFSIHDDEYKFLSGFERGGKKVLPESALLFFAWETLAMYKEVSVKDLSVVFQDVQFNGEIIIDNDKIQKINVSLNKGNDYFEICYSGMQIAKGFIAEVVKPRYEVLKEVKAGTNDEDYILNTDDIYKYFHSKGLSFRGEFQSIYKATPNGEAQVKWNENWVTFLDSLIQLSMLERKQDGVHSPKIIKKLSISHDHHNKEQPIKIEGENFFNVKYYKLYNVTRCAGVEIRDLIFEDSRVQKQVPDIVESLTFVPFDLKTEINIETAIQVNLQIVADNSKSNTISITEIIKNTTKSLTSTIHHVADYIPKVNFDYTAINIANIDEGIRNSNLIIIQDILKNGTNVAHTLHDISKDTFVLVYDNNAYELKNGQFSVISSMKIEGKDLLLLKKTHKESKKYIKVTTSDKFSWVSTLQSELQKSKVVVLVSERQPHCGLYGLVKQLRSEYSNKIGLVVVDDYAAPTFDDNNSVFKNQMQKNLSFNIMLKGQWGSYYYIKSDLNAIAKYFKLVNVGYGELDGLKWEETTAVPASENLVQVCFAGTSIKDSQKALGINQTEEDGFGLDFSGFDKNGERVMGVTKGGALASTVQADPDLLWPVPKHWSLEEAATVPLPYAHACYCLAIKGRLQKNHSVFVTGGAGALGQAIIALCLFLGCKVYTSVSDVQKKIFLLKLFPQLEEKNIGSTLLGNFKEMILAINHDQLCDFVINCASGAVREAAMKCVKAFGVFLDVSHYDKRENKPIGMSFVENDRNYYSVNFQAIFKPEYLDEKKILQSIIAQGILSGAVRPLTRVVYPASEVPRAFRLLNSNCNRGRVIIKIKDADNNTKSLKVIPRGSYSSKCTYIVICDKTELGFELANRLVRRGARKLVLHLRNKHISGLLQKKISSWQKLNTTVKISTEELNVDKNCGQVLNVAEKMGKVEGIFVILDQSDDFSSLKKEDFLGKYEIEATMLANLDVMSRNNCPDLRTFAVISKSSLNALDAFIASISDKICQTRLETGLPAVSVKVEYLDEFQQRIHSDRRLQPQNVETVLNALEICISQKNNNFVVYDLKSHDQARYLENISRCLRLQSMNGFEDTQTVGELVINELTLEELRSIIKNAYGYEVTTDNLKLMNIARLKSLGKEIQLNKKFNCGLGVFYSFVDQDEITATDVLVPIKTLVHTDTETNELDENAVHLIMIPGFEGHHRVFSTACERLKIRAMTAQIGPDVITESIQEMAESIWQTLKKTFVFKSKFYLLGYSFGVNVALEIAALSEKEGHKGIVFCLDSSPDALRLQLNTHIGDVTDSQLQNIVIKHMFKLLSNKESDEISNVIKNLDNWSDKVEYCINQISKYATFTKQYQRNIFNSAYNRILLAKNYKPSYKLNSQIVLLKGTPHPDSEKLEFDYGLSKYCYIPVEVAELTSNHVTVVQDCKLTNIINNYLDSVALEEFSRANRCNTYVCMD